MENSTNDQQRGQNEAQTGKNVAGAVMVSTSKQDDCALALRKPVGERVIHSKVTRYIAAKYGLNVWGQEFLGALDAYITMEARENIGVPERRFIDWTGARKRWKKRMDEGSRECKDLGLIDRFPFGSGFCIDISHKGRVILDDYSKRFDEIQQDFEAQHVISKLKDETKRLLELRRSGEARQRAAQAAA